MIFFSDAIDGLMLFLLDLRDEAVGDTGASLASARFATALC